MFRFGCWFLFFFLSLVLVRFWFIFFYPCKNISVIVLGFLCLLGFSLFGFGVFIFTGGGERSLLSWIDLICLETFAETETKFFLSTSFSAALPFPSHLLSCEWDQMLCLLAHCKHSVQQLLMEKWNFFSTLSYVNGEHITLQVLLYYFECALYPLTHQTLMTGKTIKYF